MKLTPAIYFAFGFHCTSKRGLTNGRGVAMGHLHTPSEDCLALDRMEF